MSRNTGARERSSRLPTRCIASPIVIRKKIKALFTSSAGRRCSWDLWKPRGRPAFSFCVVSGAGTRCMSRAVEVPPGSVCRCHGRAPPVFFAQSLGRTNFFLHAGDSSSGLRSLTGRVARLRHWKRISAADGFNTWPSLTSPADAWRRASRPGPLLLNLRQLRADMLLQPRSPGALGSILGSQACK